MVARPAIVPARRRSLIRAISGGDSFAWLRGAPVVAYAWAEQVRSRGVRNSVVLMHTTGDDAAVRTYLQAEAPWKLIWSDACHGAACGEAPRAEWIAPRIVRITRGRWMPHTRGAEQGCAALVSRHRDGAEVSVRRQVDLGADFFVPGLPERVDRVVRTSATRVLVTQRLFLENEKDQEIPLWRIVGAAGQNVRHVATDVELNRRGSAIEMRFTVLWRDLQFLQEDRRRMNRALAREAEHRLPIPARDVDVANLNLVRREVRRRQQRVESAQSTRRREEALELRALLERARARHPDEPGLARALYRVLVDPVRDGAAAFALSEEEISRGSGDEWPLRRRRAAALVGEPTLRRALVADGVVPRRYAGRAARDLTALAAQHEPEEALYEWAEAAWKASVELGSRRPRVSTQGASPASFSYDSVLETALTLAELRGLSDQSRAAYVLARFGGPRFGGLRGVATEPPKLHGPPSSRLLELREPSGATMLVGAAPTHAPSELRALGRQLALALHDSSHPAVSQGFVDLTIAFVRIGHSSTQPDRVIRMIVRSAGDHVEVVKASDGSVSWPALARYVGNPLGSRSDRLFPAPEIRIEAHSLRVAADLLERSASEPALRCRREEFVLRCASDSDPGVARRALGTLVATQLKLGR